MKLRLFLFVLTLMYFSWSLAGQCVSLGNGDWSSPATWSCGKAPGCGDTIYISAGHNVQITSQTDLTTCPGPIHLVIDGALDFTTGNKLSLPCNSSIQVNAGGQIYKSTPGGGSSTLICIECGGTCGDVWVAGGGPLIGPASIGSGLPIELIYFKVEAKGNTVKADWATASEINNERFEIERSKDGVNWVFAEKKPGAGNSSGVIYYTLIDNSPYNGLSYYRLKQVDYDGEYDYSQIVAVEVKNSNTFSVYPNPANDELYIQFSDYDFSQSELLIFSVDGRLVEAILLTDYRTQYNTSKLPSGSYYLSLVSDSGATTQKLVKQ
jgi:hypothetical protein